MSDRPAGSDYDPKYVVEFAPEKPVTDSTVLDAIVTALARGWPKADPPDEQAEYDDAEPRPSAEQDPRQVSVTRALHRIEQKAAACEEESERLRKRVAEEGFDATAALRAEALAELEAAARAATAAGLTGKARVEEGVPAPE